MLQPLLRSIESWWWERHLGVSTRGLVPTQIKGGVHYSPLPYGFIRRLLTHLHLTPDDIVADVGCGKGRVLCFAQRYHMRRVVGIEADAELLDIAKKNLSICHGATPVELIHVLAQEYDYSGVTAIVMHCPFDEATTELFCQRLDESMTREPRRLHPLGPPARPRPGPPRSGC